jgi:hypothetical protein
VTQQPAADIVAAQGVTLDLDPTDLVAGVVVLAKVVGDDGDVAIVIGATEGMTWLDQLGICGAALEIVRPHFTCDDDQ